MQAVKFVSDGCEKAKGQVTLVSIGCNKVGSVYCDAPGTASSAKLMIQNRAAQATEKAWIKAVSHLCGE